jgi:hypothetical protein
MYSSQIVNPAVHRAKAVEYSISHKNGSTRTAPTQSTRFTERFGSIPSTMSSTPAYAMSQPPTGQVVVSRISPKTDPHLGSVEYYSSTLPGVQILRRYNNVFIPQISPY